MNESIVVPAGSTKEDKDLKKRVKRTFSIHHWLGLVAGIFLLLSSITGSVLVFHHDIDHAQFDGLSMLATPAAELKIDRSIVRMLQTYPGSDIRVPELPRKPDKALKYEIRQGSIRQWVFVHPETGETLATVARADKRLVHVLLDLHYNLLSGTPGKIVVLMGGLSLILLSITGFLLYRRSIWKVLSFQQRVSFKRRRSFFSSLHRVIGVWSLVFNLFISVTGTWIAYTILKSAIPQVSATPVEHSTSALVSVDGVLEKVNKDYPEFEANYLRLAGSTLSVLGRVKSDPAYYGKTFSNLQVNLYSGQMQGVNFVKDKPWHERVLLVLKPLHFGDYAGLAVKLIYCFFGMMPGVLAVSGFIVWKLKYSKADKIALQHKRPKNNFQAVKPAAK
ncbi:PepSY-associated TM helix domain-containing protein [Pontibacter cellulosilyticus]|uniref:PepSY domain-containing protein n=1 Tax=Pontibacter cellulosilyticus TaxID=1720253 RepID=A0A923SKP3_9BACT|nr:PepSY-associated TM helix domain-containing protein [Pontibacter cellulosilyticus]MBC5993986.1 PepSY domain-containing protein [Pontibacter cellulosilyticus]